MIPSVGPGSQSPDLPPAPKKSGIAAFVLKIFKGQSASRTTEAKPMQTELVLRPTLENFKNAWAAKDSAGAYSLLCKMDSQAKQSTYIYLIEQGAVVQDFSSFESDLQVRADLLPHIIEKCKELPEEIISAFTEAWNLTSAQQTDVCKALIDVGQMDKAVTFASTLHRRADVCKHLIDKKEFSSVFALLKEVKVGNDYGDVCLYLLQKKENLQDPFVSREIDWLIGKSIPSESILEALIRIDEVDRAVSYILPRSQLNNRDAYLTAICLKYIRLWPDNAAVMICHIVPFIKKEKLSFQIYEALAASNKTQVLTQIASGLLQKVEQKESTFEQLVIGRTEALENEYRDHGLMRREIFNSIAERFNKEISSVEQSAVEDFRHLNKIYSQVLPEMDQKSRLDSLRDKHKALVEKWKNPRLFLIT